MHTMARPGVTYVEVAEIANQLLAEAKNPTIEQVRFVLGTGSSSTIAAHLKRWRASQEDATRIAVKTQIPSELIGCIKSLWERVIDESSNEFNKLEMQAHDTIQGLQDELQKYKTNNTRWQKLYDRWQEEKAALIAARDAFAADLNHLQNNHTALNCELAALNEQLSGKALYLEELQRLNRQTQDNLEHYRESVREQRLEEQAQQEQQRQQILIELNTCKHESKLCHTQLQEALGEKQVLIEHVHRLEAQSAELTATLATQAADLTQQSQRYHASLQANKSLQQQAHATQTALEQANVQLQTLQVEQQILQREHETLQTQIKSMGHATELLSQEKLILLQEKAQLEGRLLQLQQILDKKRERATA